MAIAVTHELKTWVEYFEQILSGSKKFELRLNDRNFQVGDLAKLTEYDVESKYYSGRYITIKITSVLQNDESLGLVNGFCILSFDIVEIDLREWISVVCQLPAESSIVQCKIQHCSTKGTKEYLLVKVAEDDCAWRTADDNSEVDYSWTVTHWKENILDAKEAPLEIKEAKLKQASSDFQQACNDRLARKEAEGYTGWDGEHPSQDLVEQIITDAKIVLYAPNKCNAKSLLDIGNRAMMLWHRITKNELK